MPDAIKRIFAPPTFDDPEKTRVARMLNVVLWGIVFAAIFVAILDSSILRFINIGAAVGALSLHAAMRRGYVWMNGVFVTIIIFVATLVAVYLNGTIRAPSVTGFFVAIISAALFIGKRGLIVTTLLTLAVLLGLYQAEVQGMLYDNYFTTPGTEDIFTWLIYTLGLMIMATLLLLAITSIEIAFAHAHRSAEELRQSNEELHALQNALEEDVAARTRLAEAARAQAETAQAKLREQAWQITGLAQLGDAMRGEQNVEGLAAIVLEHVANYIGAEAGVLYLLQDGALHLAAVYAYRPPEGERRSRAPSEGLMGQVLADHRPRYISTAERGFKLTSGAGEVALSHVAIHPLLYEGQPVGTMELGQVAPFTEAEIQFLEQALERIATTIATVQSQVRINALLEETQRQAEELSAQEEELRATNEELLTQAESLRNHPTQGNSPSEA